MLVQIVWFFLVVLFVIGELMMGMFYLLMVVIGLVVGGFGVLIGFMFFVQVIVVVIVVVFGIVGLWCMCYGWIMCENVVCNCNVNLDIGEILCVDVWLLECCVCVQYCGVVWDVELVLYVLVIVGEFCIVEVCGNVFVVVFKQYVNSI